MVNNINNTSKSTLVGLALMVILSYQGFLTHKTLIAKADTQNAVTDGVSRWKQNFAALGPSTNRWKQDYRTTDSMQDLMSLIKLVDFAKYGLIVSDDSIHLQKVEPVIFNNAPIGLTRICLGTSGDLMEVKATDYRTLFAGIKSLVQRSDISINSIIVKGDKPTPAADLDSFCVLTRAKD